MEREIGASGGGGMDTTSLLAFLRPTYIRTKLTGNTTFYVNPAIGSDTNDGSANDAAHAWATPQGAIDYIRKFYDLSGYDVVLQFADTTYTGNYILWITPLPNAGRFVIQGNDAHPENVIFNANIDCVSCVGNITGQLGNPPVPPTTGHWTEISGVTLTSGRCGIYNECSWVGYKNVIFGNCTLAHVRSMRDGMTLPLGNYEISGSSGSHWNSELNGMLQIYSEIVGVINVTLTGTPNFSTAFAYVTYKGYVYTVSTKMTFTGLATGRKFYVSNFGQINVGNSGVDFLPGDTDGILISGGQYDAIVDIASIQTRGFYAGNYTANGSMTWTVESGDVYTEAYQIIGKVITIWAYLINTVIGGTLNNILQFAIPENRLALYSGECFGKIDGSGYAEAVYLRIGFTAGSNILSIRKAGSVNFLAGSSANIAFTAVIPIQ